MRLELKFTEKVEKLQMNFGEVQTADDGGYERGYAEGYEIGNNEGYDKGKDEGLSEGYDNGYQSGIDAGSGQIVGLIERTLTELRNDKVTVIGGRAFQGCQSLVSVDFPNATEIGGYAFSDCYALLTINIQNVAKIYTYGLSNCRSLKQVDFNNLSSIYANAFSYCHSLTAVIIRTGTLCNLLATNAFNSCYHFHGEKHSTFNPEGLKDGYFYVPRALVEEYKVATNWATFASQFRAIEDYPEICGGEQ